MVSTAELANFIVDPDECDPRLHQAAFNGDEETLQELLENENFIENINIRSRPFGATALRLAATGGHSKCVHMLLQYGAEIDLPDYKAQTPLFVAIKNHHVECCKILLEAGANPEGTHLNRSSPLYIACQSGFVQGVQMLLRHGAAMENFDRLISGIPSTPLHISFVYQHLPCVLVLLANGAQLDLKSAFPELSEMTIAQLSLPHVIVKFQLPVIYAYILHVFGGNLWQRGTINELCTDLPQESESKAYIQTVMGVPLPLTFLCRNCIRLNVTCKEYIELYRSSLPSKIVDFINYKDIYGLTEASNIMQ